MVAYQLRGAVPGAAILLLGGRHRAMLRSYILPPQLSDKGIPKIHKPKFQLVSQPDGLKLVAAVSLQLSNQRARRRMEDTYSHPLAFPLFS